MACKRIALRRKLQILRRLTKSKSVKKSSIVADASLYICKLRLQVEAIKKEYQHHLLNQVQEVEVENVGVGYLLVRVRCTKGEEMVGQILELLEEMNVEVVEADIDCKNLFKMEAILKADIHPQILNKALLDLVQTQQNTTKNEKETREKIKLEQIVIEPHPSRHNSTKASLELWRSFPN